SVASAVPSARAKNGAAPDADEWIIWVRDDERRPWVLAHAPTRTVCLLFRPDSLLSDDAARDLRGAALAFAALPIPVAPVVRWNGAR
ncbi:MAG: hypothetical protein ABIV63_05165, partial [Caldimonas sp.]